MCKTDSCRGLLSRRGAGAVLALALLVVLGGALLWAPSAEAQSQTSGSILLGPDCCQISHSPAVAGDSVGHPNDTVHIAVRIQSTSQNGGIFVDATVVGTTTIILGCSSSGTTVSCTGAENAVLTFDSCAVESGVTACAQDPGNSNHVRITYPSGGKLVSTAPGGALVATITAHFTAGQEVLNGSTANGHVASEGQFFLLGNTGDGNLRTSAAAGSAGGSAPTFYPGFCGDGFVNAAIGETCDPNDPATSAGCRTSGPFACTRCGDGVVQSGAGETCDGTAGSVGTGCRTDCTSCGDGVVQAGHNETCDGTAGSVGTGCRTDCTSCGDGVLQASHGETCDGTAGTVGTGCRTDCTSCGDGVVQAGHGETCDGTAGSVGSGCRTDCTSCGDGVLQAGHNETCDGTAGSVGTGCRTDCTSCGDGVVQAADGETCDGGAACTTTCTAAPCDLDVEKTCAVLLPPPPFVCKTPINSLTMQWKPGSGGATSTPVLPSSQIIHLIAWNNTVGSGTRVPVFNLTTSLNNQANPSVPVTVNPGDIVKVTGLGASNNLEWQIFNTSDTLLGKSSFHISCSDVDMNSSDDCGKQEGNNKTGTTFINDWQLKGMAGPNAVLACDATNTGPASDSCVIDASGGDVIYNYKVTNNSGFKVTGITLTDDKLGSIDGTFDLDGGGASATFQSGTVHIAQTTTNTATASANGGQCIATDISTVTTGCVIAYPYNSANPLTSVVFNESEVLRQFAPNVAFAGDTIKVWYNDEHALTLGVGKVIVKTKTTTTTTYTVTPLPSNPGSAINPQVGTTLLTGDQAGTDLAGRPMFPALFITDITDDPNKCTPPGTAACRDWQFGGTGIPPHAVFGTWKGAVRNVDKTKTPTTITITPDADPATNNWNLGGGSDIPPGGFASLTNQGYGAEIRWNVNDLGLLPGHVYRMQFMVHDGDQNKTGGDVGENCLTVSIPPSPSP